MKDRAWKEKIGEYLTFSVNERWAVLLLVLLILVLFIAPRYFPGPEASLVIEDSLLYKAITKIDSASPERPGKKYQKIRASPNKENKGERFFFDPNTISIAGWISLGVREKTAITIGKYRDKGGKFRSPADLQKIYGLTPELVKQLTPFVRIASVDRPYPAIKIFPKNKPAVSIRINLADSLAWEALPGIGKALASRIINFRSRLGGFYSGKQVAEVYGLQDSTFKKIEPLLEEDGQPVIRLPLNSATVEELAAHPYIRSAIANAIVQYRTAHGRFQQLDDLRKIHLIDQNQFEKINRYCKID